MQARSRTQATREKQQYGKQLTSTLSEDTRALRDFINGKSPLKDHQGVELSASGMRYDSLGQAAIDERELIRIQNQQKRENQEENQDGSQAEGKDGYTESSEEEMPPQTVQDYIKLFLKNKNKEQSPESRMDSSNDEDEDGSAGQQEQESLLANLLKINLDQALAESAVGKEAE